MQSGSSTAKRGRLIKWDEETIAEHDKERGTRQKIMEADTPFQYSSDNELSDELSEGLASMTDAERAEHMHMMGDLPGAKPSGAESIMHSWQEVHAKLHYHKHVQEQLVVDEETLVPSSSQHQEGYPIAASDMESSAVVDIIESSMEVEGASILPNSSPHSSEKSDFKDKRAAHYNEFSVLRALRNQMELDDEEEDED